jgi:hypothetical protein
MVLLEVMDMSVSLGIPVGATPQELGLPTCDTTTRYDGIPAGASVPEDEKVACAVDPRTVLYGVGLPTPHAGYHWNGFRTQATSFTGGKIEVEVTNPAVDHQDGVGDNDEFVANRVLSQQTSGDWIEAGWAEVSWQTGQRVYTYKTATGAWSFYGYDLSTGSNYAFRTRHCTLQGAGTQCAEIYWNGGWQLLDSSGAADCTDNNGDARCAVEEFTEIYSEQSGSPHPGLTADSSNRIDWRDTELRLEGGTWISWTRPSSQGTQTAYDTCRISDYYRFYAKKGTC